MDMQKLMKQAQKMQQQVNQAQAKLQETEVEGVAGGGVVKVTATGGNTIKAIEIAPEVVDPEEIEMLQDLILAAINDAMNKANELANSEMGKITGGMKMPF